MEQETDRYETLVHLAQVVAKECDPNGELAPPKDSAEQEGYVLTTRFSYLDRTQYDAYEWRRTEDLRLTPTGRFTIWTQTQVWDPGLEETYEVRYATREDLLLLDNSWGEAPLMEQGTKTGYLEGFRHGAPEHKVLYAGAIRWLEGARRTG